MFKRSPYKVGQKVRVDEIKPKMNGRAKMIPAGTGGFVVTEVISQPNQNNGGYFITAESNRNINGGKVHLSWHVMWPHFKGRKTPTEYLSAFRIIVEGQAPTRQANAYIPRQEPVSMEDRNIVAKSVPSGSRPKRIVLADFLEE